MRLVRHGAPGAETPLLSAADGVGRDLRPVVDDLTPRHPSRGTGRRRPVPTARGRRARPARPTAERHRGDRVPRAGLPAARGGDRCRGARGVDRRAAQPTATPPADAEREPGASSAGPVPALGCGPVVGRDLGSRTAGGTRAASRRRGAGRRCGVHRTPAWPARGAGRWCSRCRGRVFATLNGAAGAPVSQAVALAVVAWAVANSSRPSGSTPCVRARPRASIAIASTRCRPPPSYQQHDRTPLRHGSTRRSKRRHQGTTAGMHVGSRSGRGGRAGPPVSPANSGCGSGLAARGT
ncbi:hypothetical protein SHL15_9119 [Streptomyces hygroscopicus subsp. limoneus]|nr:hypothetical protein SHL15_9119 [Streptomyces hygroscopicus subsp. limoneus]